jgi:hypothetical protein
MSRREDPTIRILQRWTEVLTEEMQRWVQNLLADKPPLYTDSISVPYP